jgi:CarboxypepD_reg-like domain
MNRILRFVVILCFLIPASAHAQFEMFKDSVVQLYGVVMSADSLKPVPSASIVIKGQNRGTISNYDGVFSIVALKGDVIEFTSVGYQAIKITIPTNLQGNQHSIVQLMATDTSFLAATIIKPRLTREQFERDFINNQVPDDQLTVARKNTNAQTRRALMAMLPSDGREASTNFFNKEFTKMSYKGQVAPQNILSPAAWLEFIKAWKRGDFKKKS